MKKYKKAIKIGTKIEKEHKDTYDKIRKYRCRITPIKMYRSIAQDHIKELGPRYYYELLKLERRLKHGRKYRKH